MRLHVVEAGAVPVVVILHGLFGAALILGGVLVAVWPGRGGRR